MNSRIKKIRNHMKLSQDEFGARLGITGSGVSNLESGRRGITEQMIKSICREFAIDEHWLRYGGPDEKMFVPQNINLMFDGPSLPLCNPELFKKTILRAAEEMSDEWWDLFYQKFLNLVRPTMESQPISKTPPTPEEFEKLYPPIINPEGKLEKKAK